MATPTWSAARNGLTGDTNAVDKSAQIDQYLGLHGVTPIYAGTPVVANNGSGVGNDDTGGLWVLHMDQFQYDQPFAMVGTNIGRVQIPMLAVGSGSDVKVSLCNDSAGVPGSVIASTIVPNEWITAFSKVVGLPTPSTNVVIGENDSPLATSASTIFLHGALVETPWTSPAASAAGAGLNPIFAQGGNYSITLGGTLADGVTPVNGVFTVSYPGSGFQIGAAIPQPVLPQATDVPGLSATSDFVVVAGGFISALITVPPTANVWVAPWDSTGGVIGAWSAQAPLPVGTAQLAGAAFGDTVYMIGGVTGASFVVTNAVFYSTIVNGQITGWTVGPPLPQALIFMEAAVVGNFLIVVGGQNGPGTVQNTVYYAAINDDGSIDNWQTGPPLPQPTVPFTLFVEDSGLIAQGGTTTGGAGLFASLALTVDSTGLGHWTEQDGDATDAVGFAIDVGQYQMFAFMPTAYDSWPVFLAPSISVPLPVTGLTNGTTYHLLIQPEGGTAENYVRLALDSNGLPGDPTAQFRNRDGSGSWVLLQPGQNIPITVYNQSPGGQVLHTWEDSGKRTSTLVYATTPDQRLLGIADSVQFLDGSVVATVTTVDYPDTWPGQVWPPLGAQQIA